MSDFRIETFKSADDRVRAATYAGVIENRVHSEDGGELCWQDINTWFKKGVICHVATDPRTGQIMAGAAVVPNGIPQGTEGELIGVCVMPAARDHGLGHDLMHSVIADSTRRGLTRLTLDIRFYDDGMPPAPFHLYQSHGFELEAGIKVTRIGWDPRLRHLWLHRPDPGGVFRSRMMSRDLIRHMQMSRTLQSEVRDAR